MIYACDELGPISTYDELPGKVPSCHCEVGPESYLTPLKRALIAQFKNKEKVYVCVLTLYPEKCAYSFFCEIPFRVVRFFSKMQVLYKNY